MPKIDEIKNNQSSKSFKKREYRPWNIDGNSISPDMEKSKDKFMQGIIKDIREAEKLFNEIQNEKKQKQITMTNVDTILEVDCSIIKNWEFHDRPEGELGDIEGLASEFKEIGQQQPCIVRELSINNQYKYELIVGERRWHAAKVAGLKLKVIVKKLSDQEAAIIQASENYNRKDLSDYARGMSYSKLIDNNIITPKDLAEKLGISKQQISRLLSFAKIPVEITSQIQDMSKISSRTAEQIKQLSSKGSNYTEAIISLADKLRNGDIGQEKLQLLVEKKIQAIPAKEVGSNKIFNPDGEHLYTIKEENNIPASIIFSKKVMTMFNEEQININRLNQMLQIFFARS
ncbi:Plasmid partitioning protein ParB (plasmid) [Rickettsiales bacterium Ac37b]|nr:Plasmid partitioning protein ParB [Rickettsiales bacterium Ac37b]